MDNNLGNTAVKGVKWTTLSTLFVAVSFPVYRILLAQYLTPQEFAYIAIVSLFIAVSALLNSIGLGEAIIQRDAVDKYQISTIFFANLLLSIILALFFYFISGYIQLFYGLSNLGLIIKLLSISVIFNGTSSLFRVYLQKSLLFKEYAISQIIKVLSDIVSTLVFVVFGFGVLGYVYGTIISTFIYASILILYARSRTDMMLIWYFNLKDAVPFIKFGYSISIKKIITHFSHSIDEIIIGRFLPADVLGSYYLGKSLLLQLQTLLTNSFSQVLFPYFSRMKHDKVKLRETYLKVTYIVSLISFPIFIGASITAHLFVPLLFGDEWIDSVKTIRILSIAMIFLVLTANLATSLLYSVNKPNAVLKIEIVSTILYSLSLVVLGEKGIYVVLVLYSTYLVLKTMTLQFYVGKDLDFSFISYFINMKWILLSTTVMVVILVPLLRHQLSIYSNIVQFIVSAIIGMIAYIVLLIVVDRQRLLRLFRNPERKEQIVRQRGV